MEKQKKISKVIIVAPIIIIIITILGIIAYQQYISNTAPPEKLNWELILLSEEIPHIQSDTAQIIENTEEALQIKIIGISKEEMLNYIDFCKEKRLEMDPFDDKTYWGQSQQYGGSMEITYIQKDEVMYIKYTALPKVNWDQLKLGEYLPIIESRRIAVYEQEYLLSLSIYQATSKQYDDYIQECIEYGYNIDTYNDQDYFTSYNQNNYSITVYYNNFESSIDISLSAPPEFKEIKWPDTDISNLLPVPKSNEGIINLNSEIMLNISIGKTTQSDYDAYVEACIDKGFNVRPENIDRYTYAAENNEGYYLSIQYDERISSMTIDIMHPDNIEIVYH